MTLDVAGSALVRVAAQVAPFRVTKQLGVGEPDRRFYPDPRPSGM